MQISNIDGVNIVCLFENKIQPSFFSQEDSNGSFVKCICVFKSTSKPLSLEMEANAENSVCLIVFLERFDLKIEQWVYLQPNKFLLF